MPKCPLRLLRLYWSFYPGEPGHLQTLCRFEAHEPKCPAFARRRLSCPAGQRYSAGLRLLQPSAPPQWLRHLVRRVESLTHGGSSPGLPSLPFLSCRPRRPRRDFAPPRDCLIVAQGSLRRLASGSALGALFRGSLDGVHLRCNRTVQSESCFRVPPRGFFPDPAFGREQSNSTGRTRTRMATSFTGARLTS